MSFKLFHNCKEDEILKTFENTILKVLESVEKTTNKFYEMTARIENSHFNKLASQSEKQSRMFEKNLDKFLKLLEDRQQKQKEVEFERISRIDSAEANSIEKEEEIENPLEDISPATFSNAKSLQFEGEEEIFPISIE